MDNLNEQYNGWSNYETWLVSLWIDSEDIEGDSEDIEGDNSKEIAENLKKCIYANNPLLENRSSRYSDLIKASLSRVNWQEIVDKLS
jgi:hypothetical protein